MTLTLAQAVDAIQVHFNTACGVPSSPLTPVAYDNLPFDAEAQTTAWVRLSVQSTAGTIASIGAVGTRRFRAFGFVFVQVFTPVGANRVQNDTLAQTAKDAFKGVQLTGGLWFRNEQIVSVGVEGKWYQQNFSAEFLFDETE